MISLKTKWWWPYLAIQAVSFFHWFYPLPFHYRHLVGKWAVLPAMPGVFAGMLADACIRSGSVTRIIWPKMNLADGYFVAIIAGLFNCGIFAIAVWITNWHHKRDVRPISS